MAIAEMSFGAPLKLDRSVVRSERPEERRGRYLWRSSFFSFPLGRHLLPPGLEATS
jgi:hypothetical protein